MLISGNTKELGERFLEFFRTGVLCFSERKEESSAPAADYSGGCIFLEFYKYLSKQTDSGSGFYILYLVVIAICLEAYQSMNLYAEEKQESLSN